MSELWQVMDDLDADVDQAEKVYAAAMLFKEHQTDGDLINEGLQLQIMCRENLRLSQISRNRVIDYLNNDTSIKRSS